MEEDMSNRALYERLKAVESRLAALEQALIAAPVDTSTKKSNKPASVEGIPVK